MYFIAATENFINLVGQSIDILGTLSIAANLVMVTRAYTVYLTVDQMRYECRDELFKNLIKLKRIRELKSEKQELYDSLMEILK